MASSVTNLREDFQAGGRLAGPRLAFEEGKTEDVNDSPPESDRSSSAMSDYSSRYDQLQNFRSTETFNTELESIVDQLSGLDNEIAESNVPTQDLAQGERFSPPPPPPPLSNSGTPQPTPKPQLFSMAAFLANIPPAPPAVPARATPVMDAVDDVRISDLTSEIDRYGPALLDTPEAINLTAAADLPDYEVPSVIYEEDHTEITTPLNDQGYPPEPDPEDMVEPEQEDEVEFTLVDDAEHTGPAAAVSAGGGEEVLGSGVVAHRADYHVQDGLSGAETVSHDHEEEQGHPAAAPQSSRPPITSAAEQSVEEPRSLPPAVPHVSLVNQLPQQARSPSASDYDGSSDEGSRPVSIELSPIAPRKAVKTPTQRTSPSPPTEALAGSTKPIPTTHTKPKAVNPKAAQSSRVTEFERGSTGTTPSRRQSTGSTLTPARVQPAITAVQLIPGTILAQQSPTERVETIDPLSGRKTAARDESPQPEADISYELEPAPSPPISTTRPRSPPKPRPGGAVYDLHVADELDAWAQYKASLLLQTQLVEKIMESKTILGQKVVIPEDRLRESMSLEITTEMLQRAAMHSEVLGCIALGRPLVADTGTLAGPRGGQGSGGSSNGRHSGGTVAGAGRSPSATRWQTPGRVVATPRTPVTTSRGRGSVLGTGGSGAGAGAGSGGALSGWRSDTIRRTLAGAIDSTPLTGGLKRSTSRLNRGGSEQRTLYPTTPIEALLKDPAAVHSLVGNIDNYCSCCRTKLVEVNSLKSLRGGRHSQCQNCIHR